MQDADYGKDSLRIVRSQEPDGTVAWLHNEHLRQLSAFADVYDVYTNVPTDGPDSHRYVSLPSFYEAHRG